jgi:hypothetical protein
MHFARKPARVARVARLGRAGKCGRGRDGRDGGTYKRRGVKEDGRDRAHARAAGRAEGAECDDS